jgi:hypothetical protein
MILGFSDAGCLRGAVITPYAFGSISMLCSPGRVPEVLMSSKKSLNLDSGYISTTISSFWILTMSLSFSATSPLIMFSWSKSMISNCIITSLPLCFTGRYNGLTFWLVYDLRNFLLLWVCALHPRESNTDCSKSERVEHWFYDKGSISPSVYPEFNLCCCWYGLVQPTCRQLLNCCHVHSVCICVEHLHLMRFHFQTIVAQ